MPKRMILGLIAACVVLYTKGATADTFAPGSLIIPMDTTYQDNGMLKAYGLVYSLLRNGVPVQWVIRPGKAHLGVDFTASAIDHKTSAVISSHGYRGGPWVIDSADAANAMPIIDAWLKANPAVAVHQVTADFWGDVARYLVVAPTIAMHQDGNEAIARSYLQAAGIPDSTLDPTWPTTSPDMLTPAEVAGPTTTNHHDGKLFDAKGNPVYCQFMSMHWAVTEAAASPETVLEVREFLKHPVHFFAECQAVNAFEGAPPTGGRGNFLTTQGFTWPAPAQPKTYDFYNDSFPFAQIDGPFASAGGSEPAYSLPVGGAYKSGGVVMITKSGTPEGDSDVWMTGFLDGACTPDLEGCSNNYGKVSYLGGHQYSTSLPISKNPQTQGTRLFLNSLFEAPCATASGQPGLVLKKVAPRDTLSPTVTYDLYYQNYGSGVALSAVISDTLPSGGTFVSATSGGTLVGNKVIWNLGNLGGFESGYLSLTVTFGGFGSYANTAQATYKVGLNSFTVNSNTTSTLYDKDSDGDGIIDSLDNCPNNYNPQQDLLYDATNCGSCGNTCSAPNTYARCTSGACAIGTCMAGYSDCDGLYSNGCEHLDVGQKCCDCAPSNGSGACVAGACTITTCNPGFSDCDNLASTGCEYDSSGFSSDVNRCGGCNVQCSYANATASCIAGACQMGACSSGYVDADHSASNGCECHKIATTDTTCDGIDDDCNGVADDGFQPTSCGVGACASLSRCTVGTIIPCLPGAASTEGPAGDATCADGVDNDCNGVSDGADSACFGGTGGAGYGGAPSSTGGDTSTGGSTDNFSGGTGATLSGGTSSIIQATGGDLGFASGGIAALSSGGSYATLTGGAFATGGAIAIGGSVANGGALATGGWLATGGALATGGWLATGGALSTGGWSTSGGVVGIGGAVSLVSGGASGSNSDGTNAATGGAPPGTGGALAIAGSATVSIGGATTGAGGSNGVISGGTQAGGGAALGGDSSSLVASGGFGGLSTNLSSTGGTAGATSSASNVQVGGTNAASVGGTRSSGTSLTSAGQSTNTSSATGTSLSGDGSSGNEGGCSCRVGPSSPKREVATTILVGLAIALGARRNTRRKRRLAERQTL